MADEKRQEEELQEEQMGQQEQQQPVEEAPVEQTQQQEEAPAEVTEEQKAEEPKPEVQEKETKEEPQPAEEKEKVAEEEVPVEEEQKEQEEEAPAEEAKVEDGVAPEEEQVNPEVAEEEVVEDVEKIKHDLAEKEAELAEEKAIKAYEDDVREANSQLDSFLHNLGNAMVQEFAKYGIDPNVSLEDLRKQDPAKAQVAENIINQAQAVKAQAMNNVQNNLDARLRDVVFEKASRLFDKFEMTAEQGMVAAETFVNIMEQSGIRDMGDDLIAKVELAVARAKMLKPKVEAVIDDAKEVAQEAIEAVKDIIEEKADKEEAPEEKDKVETEASEAPKEPESVIETPTLDEFTESAVVSSQAAGEAINEDNVMQKMAELPFRERTAFYKEHRELIEKAARKETIKRAGNNKV